MRLHHVLPYIKAVEKMGGMVGTPTPRVLIQIIEDFLGRQAAFFQIIGDFGGGRAGPPLTLPLRSFLVSTSLV